MICGLATILTLLFFCGAVMLTGGSSLPGVATKVRPIQLLRWLLPRWSRPRFVGVGLEAVRPDGLERKVGDGARSGLQAALDEGTIADASAVKWDSGMVFAAPADLVSLKVALFRMERGRRLGRLFIGGKALQRSWPRSSKVRPPCSGDAGVSPAPGDVADAVSAGDADSGHAGDGAGYAARGWGGEECPGEKGTAAAKTASATDTAKSKKSPSGSDVSRTRITTRMHMGMGRRIGNDEGPRS
ncbi:hypothetical protein PAPYR_9831 [Paratrimastix pyriformis]|uniref:Uncharacterized protein n=1 Tax=Paratrimastix pyriformis TaxID=342808 RepID=A0ABQ8U922_9EUKA|nr:hypothetical protein PAPYR_9831 [Paratrimastix pyriformis]